MTMMLEINLRLKLKLKCAPAEYVTTQILIGFDWFGAIILDMAHVLTSIEKLGELRSNCIPRERFEKSHVISYNEIKNTA